jgi:aminoglycoside N3'-acetyltransferase
MHKNVVLIRNTFDLSLLLLHHHTSFIHINVEGIYFIFKEGKITDILRVTLKCIGETLVVAQHFEWGLIRCNTPPFKMFRTRGVSCVLDVLRCL